MPHSQEEKKSAIHRLNRIRGQADALVLAIEKGSECGAVLQQLAALRGAVNGLMSEILESHLKDTFTQAGEVTQAVPEAVQESLEHTMGLVRTYLK